MKEPQYSTPTPVYPGGYVPKFDFLHSSESAGISVPPVNELLPKPEMISRAESYELNFRVPGMRREDFQVDAQGRELVVFLFNQPASRKRGNGEEMSYEVVSRTIQLPPDADALFTLADYRAGVLRLTVPRAVNPVSCTGVPVVVY